MYIYIVQCPFTYIIYILYMHNEYHIYIYIYIYIYMEKMKVLVTQSHLTLCDPLDCGSPDSSVHGILQAIIV